jgi:hypothetical protein
LVVGVLLVEPFKNVVLEPLVLGGAAKLHPLIVVIGVLGGGILFGLPGLLLAIPTITVVVLPTFGRADPFRRNAIHTLNRSHGELLGKSGVDRAPV